MPGIRLASLVDLFYPRSCLACGRRPLPPRREWLCSRCLARIEPLPPDPCPVCAAELGPGVPSSACDDCRRLRPRFDGAVAVGAYDGLLSELIGRLKYGRSAMLAWPLGALLADTVRLWPAAEAAETVVPTPLSLSRRLKRGFNQAELLAVEVARRLRLPLARFARGARGGGRAQAGLSRTERLRARRGAFAARRPAERIAPILDRLPAAWGSRIATRLRPRVAGRTVLLVDDVLTTGATASDAARALKTAGATRVLVAVVARA